MIYRWVLHALELYVKMTVENPDPIETYSPSKVRKLLLEVLTKSRAINLNVRGGAGANLVQENPEGDGVEGLPTSATQLPPVPTYCVGDVEVIIDGSSSLLIDTFVFDGSFVS
jgi:hypothetical protein